MEALTMDCVFSDEDILIACLRFVTTCADACSSAAVSRRWCKLWDSAPLRQTWLAIAGAGGVLALPRRMHPTHAAPTCAVCKRTFRSMGWSDFEAFCGACCISTLLPPAPAHAWLASPGHVMWRLHGEETNDRASNVQKLRGCYAVQTSSPTGWTPSNVRVRAPSLISKRKLATGFGCQLRVRARLGPCKCGAQGSVIICMSRGDFRCRWTPWSEPSEAVTPSQSA